MVGVGLGLADRRDSGGVFLQPPDVGMADELLVMRRRENDCMEAWLAFDLFHERLQPTGDVKDEQAVRAAGDREDQYGSPVVDLEPAFVSMCHGPAFRDTPLLYLRYRVYSNLVMAFVSTANRTSLPVPEQDSAAQPGGSMGDVPRDPTPG